MAVALVADVEWRNRMVDMPTLEEAKRNVLSFIEYAEQRDAAQSIDRTAFYKISRAAVKSADTLDALFAFLTEAWLLNDAKIAETITVRK